MQTVKNNREERGQAIAQSNGQVKRLDDCTYTVKSQSHNGEYTVHRVGEEWVCSCPDNTYRHLICKHIFAVDFSVELRSKVSSNRVIQEVNIHKCQLCGSEEIVKAGIRKNQNGNIQKYLCRKCGHYFTINLGFEHMKATPQIVTSAMQLYFTGESLRNVQKFLKLQGVTVSHVAILKWIKKYVKLMENYLEKMKPNVGDTWRADELWIKVNGNLKYLFAMMDDETRFWIAQEVAETKEKHDARNLLAMSKRLMGKKPEVFITDGLRSYHEAYLKEFWTLKNPRTKHIKHIKLSGDMHNNKMERMNGEIRDREKTMRGLKIDDTPILKGYQLYHNFIRPHEALEGKTPAEACGITVEGKNKWLTIIQNASKSQQCTHN
jgi:putative transposase